MSPLAPDGRPRHASKTRREEGPARLGRTTKRLVERLRPGDVAVIDHPDVDRLSAEALVDRGVRCVVNVSASSTGRYPNEGPGLLVDHGVHLVDAPGAPLFEVLTDGETVSVAGSVVLGAGRRLAEGAVLGRADVAASRELAAPRLAAARDAFVANTVARLRGEAPVLVDSLSVPPLRTHFAGRAALVVARATGAREVLRALAPFVRATRPVLVGVDGGADSLLDAGLVPEVIVGDMDSASDRALRCGAELVVHAYRDGRAPGGPRLARLIGKHTTFLAPGTSEDAGLLLAAEAGSAPIVSVGVSFDLVELLDRGRAGMASSLLVRLRLGDRLVDARGVGRAPVGRERAAPGREPASGSLASLTA